MKKTLLFSLLLAATGAVMAQSVPNGTFENWNSTSYDELNGWKSSNPQSLAQIGVPNVTKVTGFSSANAVRMETKAVGLDTIPGFIINTSGDPLSGEGGVPFSQQPTAITGYYRYNLAGNDSATLLVIFKKNGNPISYDVFKIRGTGSQPGFTSFSFPISLPQTPDSVIVAASCSNALEDEMVAGSWMELDSLKFTGPSVTQSLPNGTFENWNAMSLDVPQGWHLNNTQAGVSKTTDKYTGTYALKLVTQDLGGGDVEPASITTANNGGNGLFYTLTTDTLTGYYKYIPAGNDSASIWINLSQAGSPVGGIQRKLIAAANYTYFEIPFTAFQTPDSIRIDIQSSDWSNVPSVGGSALYVDKLQLKSQPLNIIGFAGKGSFIAYPNPAQDILNIMTPRGINSDVTISLVDVMGKEVWHSDAHVNGGEIVAVPVAQLPAGLYHYTIRTGNEVISNKFIKE